MKKRVLITTGIFPPDIGGPATFLSYLAEDLGKADFDVSVLTHTSERKRSVWSFVFGDNLNKYNFKVRRVYNKFGFLLNIFLMARKADVIYTHDLYTAGFCSYLVKKVFPKKKLIIRFVGDSAWEKSVSYRVTEDDLLTFNQKKYDAKTEKLKRRRFRILKKADAIITASEFLKKVLLAIRIEESKIKVIYNSVDFLQEQFDEPLDKKRFKVSKGLFTIKETEGVECTGMCVTCSGHDISTDGKVILTIARLVKWKGIEALIEIMPDLAAKYGDVKLVVLGDGPERERLEEKDQEAKRLHSSKGTMEPTDSVIPASSTVILSPQANESRVVKMPDQVRHDIVFLKGRVEHRKTLDYLKIADIFVLNTNYEGLSHTILEAMNLGVPVVTTPAGGNAETIENEKTGLLIEFNNKEQIKKAIGRLLKDEKLGKTLAKNAKKSLDKFNWEKLVEETRKCLMSNV